MFRHKLLPGLFVALVFSAPPVAVRCTEVDLDAALKNIVSEDASTRSKAFDDVLLAGLKGIEKLTKILVEPGKGDDAGVRFALHGLAMYVTRPGGEADRAAFVKVLTAQLRTDLTVEVKRFLISQLQIAGREDAVLALAGFLSDERLAESARQALLANPTPAAVKALRDALPKAKGLLRVGIIQALGIRKDRAAAQVLLAETRSADPAVRKAATEALHRIGVVF